jgi:(p)ppGpp synthase/HD superfamily hydrolase
MTTLLTPRLLEAVTLSAKAHATATRKGSDTPYIVHPMAVFGLLAKWDADEETCIAGILHDVIEDAPTVEQSFYRVEIEDKFGPHVLEIVEGVTEQDKSLPWKERKDSYLAHLREASQQSLLVSCADQTHNLACLVEDYRREGETVWKRFNAIKQWKVWFIDQVRDILKERLEEKYVAEFLANLKELNALLSLPLPPEYLSGMSGEGGMFIMDPLYQELWDHCMLTEQEMKDGMLEDTKNALKKLYGNL